MKLYNVKNTEEFFRTVTRCNGKVELVTDSGIYNLKSKLSQIAASAKEFARGPVREIEIRLSDPMDTNRFIQYCLN